MSLHDRTSERAYYRWLNNPESSPLGNWLESEREELQLIHEVEAASAAPSPPATFHFQRLLIEVETQSASLFDETDGRLRFDSPWAPFLIHELVHYVQSTTTVLGQRILMNWFAVAIGVAQALKTVKPLRLPLHHPRACADSRIANANRELDEYFAEARALAGTVHPFRSHDEAQRHSPFALYDYSWSHPRNGESIVGVAASLRTEDTPTVSALGVPLLGDAFTEGMAQVAQHLCAGDDIQAKLKPIVNSQTLYYSVVYRVLRARFPRWNAALLTLILTDAALCSRTPGTTFARLLTLLADRRPPDSDVAYLDLRRQLQKLPALQEGAAFIAGEIETADAGIPHGQAFGELFRHLLRVFRRAWQARTSDPAVFVDMEYRADFVERMIRLVGAPPIAFSDRTHLVRLAPDLELERACHALRGAYDILVGLRALGPSECPLLRSKACASRKVHACRTNVLEAPIPSDGRTCAMVFAALQLELHGRSVVWI